MWMMLGLVGVLVASSMVDVFVPAEGAGDIDESGDGGADEMTDASAATGDLMPGAGDPDGDSDGDSDGGSNDAPTVGAAPSAGDADEDGLPFHNASGDGSAADAQAAGRSANAKMNRGVRVMDVPIDSD